MGGGGRAETQTIQPDAPHTPLDAPLTNNALAMLAAAAPFSHFGAGYQQLPSMLLGQTYMAGPNQTIYGNPFNNNVASQPYYGAPGAQQVAYQQMLPQGGQLSQTQAANQMLAQLLTGYLQNQGGGSQQGGSGGQGGGSQQGGSNLGIPAAAMAPQQQQQPQSNQQQQVPAQQASVPQQTQMQVPSPTAPAYTPQVVAQLPTPEQQQLAAAEALIQQQQLQQFNPTGNPNLTPWMLSGGKA